ncbi:MAG: hypothetical protein FWF38_01970 [Spirochaetaceae bacterium]|nr:hypothetical protein [Spirochaetaceae bacterium]
MKITTEEEARFLCSAIPGLVVMRSFFVQINVLDLYVKAANAKSLSEMQNLIIDADNLLIAQNLIAEGSHNWGLREFLDIPPAGNYDDEKGSR